MKSDETRKKTTVSEKTFWERKRRKLTSFSYSEDWGEAIDLFHSRISKKYFEPLNLLIKCGNDEGAGFSVVAIECLLIEMFAAFRYGKIFNVRYSEDNDPPYQFKDSQSLYVDFLTTEEPFKKQFAPQKQSEIIIDSDKFSAPEFYTAVRCGLLHEGRTKKNWTINLKPKTENPGKFLGREGNKLKIYRTVLLKKLEDYLGRYTLALKSDGENNDILRKHFARKMDNLYGLKPNKKEFDWWKY